MRFRRALFLLLGAVLLLGQAGVPVTLSPNSGSAGSTVDVTVNGPALSPNAMISFDPPGTLVVTNPRSDGAHLRFTLQISPRAAAGGYAFVYEAPSLAARNQLRVPNAFTVTAPPSAPVVRSITPAQITAGNPPGNVLITGINFVAGATVRFSGSGVIANVLTVTGSSISAQVAATEAAAAGPRNVIVTNPDGSSNAKQSPPVQITVLAARPKPAAPPVVAVRSITPNQIGAGDPPVSATITGTGFVQGARVTLSGSGLLATVKSVSPSSISADVVAAPGAAAGPRDVIVTNPDGSSNAKQLPAVQLNVRAARPPPPTAPSTPAVIVRSIKPNQVTAGAGPVEVTINGTGFAAAASVSFSGSGVTAAVKSVAPSSIVARVTADASAAPTARDVIVTNPDGSSNAKQLPAVQLTVLPPAPAQPAPRPIFVRTVKPNQITAGAPPIHVTLRGEGFDGVVTVKFSGNGVIGKLLTRSATVIEAEVTAIASAAAGPRKVIVTRSDGTSNATQAPSVTLTVVPPPPVPTPTTPPPGIPPTTTTPVTPPTTTPPVTPPVTPPPTTTKPPVPPPVTPPPVTPPVTPPPLAPVPPNVPAPVTPVVPPLEPPVKPPTELLIGPRIDKVTPSQLEPGKKYKLDLEGKNLAIDTKISLGGDVTFVGAPLIKSPTSAIVDVLVSPAAKPGVVAAIAASPKGRNSGPGGVLIGTMARARPPAAKPTPGAAKKHFKQPTGDIVLDAPCDPDLLFSPECDEPVTLNDSTVFVWHELNPGVAKFFVFEIVDSDQKVLFSAQTPKKYYRLSNANLASLPRIETAPLAFAATASLGGRPKKPASKNKGAVYAAPSDGVSASTKPIALATSKPIKHGDSKALTEAMKTSGPGGIKLGVDRAIFAGRKPVSGEVYWRVRGMSNKIAEETGMKLPEMVQSEDSPERAIVLPLPPNGFSCNLGTNSTLGDFVPRFTPSIWTYLKRPKPCPDESLNICGVADLAEFPSSARLDLRRLPFALQQIGDFGSSSEVTLQNIFIDWGDGTEPQPLKVKGVLSKGTQKLSSVRLVMPGNDDNKRLSHRYFNENQDAEYVMYKVRIFALADPDETHPAQVSEITKSESKPLGSLTSLGFGAQSDAVSVSAAKPSATATASASASPAPSTSAVASLMSRMFTIACSEVKVWNPWGVGADEPLHLLTADVIFPTDSDAAKSQIKGKGKTPAKEPMPSSSDASLSTSTKGATASRSGTGGATASASLAPPKPGQLAAASELPVTGLPPVPSISDCSSAFKAAVRLTYWGHGKVKLVWYLDGVLLETTEVPSELPPVSTANGEAGKKPYMITMMAALPPVLQAQLHKLTVHAEVVKLKPIMIKPGGSHTAPAEKVVKLGETQQSYAHVNQTYSVSTPKKKKSTGAMSLAVSPETSMGATPFVVFVAPPAEPGSQVDSPIRYYRVVDHKTLGMPCALRYMTAQTGMFEITDLSSFTQTGDKASGSGMLELYFPSYDGEAISLQPVKVSFTGWTLAAAGNEDEDILDVKAGALEQGVGSEPAIIALNFPLKLQKISLTPDRLALDGDVRIQSGMGFTNETADELPRWEFASTPLTSEGDFRFTKSKTVNTELGASQFELKINNAEIDFSRKEGSGPAQSCTSAATDSTWQGIRIDGVLSAPDTLQFNNVKLLKDYPFTGWGIGPAGLSVKFDDASFSKQVSTSGVGIKATGFTFSVCNGSFGSPTFGVEVSNAPLVVQTIKGKITLDSFAVPHSSFAGISVDHDWGNVKGNISHASLGYSPTVGNFAITINSHFWFKVRGKPAYDTDYDGILITLDGNVYSPAGGHYYAVPEAGTANIAGYPMQVTQLGVGNKPNGDVWFGFMGDIEVGEHAPNAEDREAQFILTKKSAAMHSSDPIQIASLGEIAYFDSPDQGFDYSSSDEGGVTVNKVHLDFSYPPTSKTVTVVADCEWQELENGFYFIGVGKVTVADSFGIDIEALYGRDGDASYWMVKAAVDLPTMMALGSTGFGLKAIHGGLGCSVPISAYDMPDIKMVQTDHSGAYSFSAGVDIGTMDAFTIYCRGRLTVKMGGSDAGARLSLAAWLVTSTHELPAMGEACMQYAGGAFDAGATVHLSLASGLIVIDAPKSGPDVCTQAAVSIHFGGSADWHVWIGQETLPLTAKVLIIDGNGYLMIDGNGTEMYNAATIDKKWSVSIAGFSAYVKINGGTAVTVTIVYDPFWVKGAYKGWVTIKAGADIVGGCCSISFGANLGFSAEGPPVKVCGKVGISFSTPWPLSDIHATVGPLCLGG